MVLPLISVVVLALFGLLVSEHGGRLAARGRSVVAVLS